MSFPLRVNKTVQAIGVLFRADRVKRMNYMRLLKLLYIADRDSLNETGRPIVGGAVVAMERGPVLLEVFDLIRGQHREMPLWAEYFQKDRYDLQLIKEPDVGKLSRFEIAKLQEIAKRHEEDDEWALSRLTHTFAEWQKNNPGSSCRPIPLNDILEAVGQGEFIEEIVKDAQDVAVFQRAFEG
jgi:uncharacterized phage-associated protein